MKGDLFGTTQHAVDVGPWLGGGQREQGKHRHGGVEGAPGSAVEAIHPRPTTRTPSRSCGLLPSLASLLGCWRGSGGGGHRLREVMASDGTPQATQNPQQRGSLDVTGQGIKHTREHGHGHRAPRPGSRD